MNDRGTIYSGGQLLLFFGFLLFILLVFMFLAWQKDTRIRRNRGYEKTVTTELRTLSEKLKNKPVTNTQFRELTKEAFPDMDAAIVNQRIHLDYLYSFHSSTTEPNKDLLIATPNDYDSKGKLTFCLRQNGQILSCDIPKISKLSDDELFAMNWRDIDKKREMPTFLEEMKGLASSRWTFWIIITVTAVSLLAIWGKSTHKRLTGWKELSELYPDRRLLDEPLFGIHAGGGTAEKIKAKMGYLDAKQLISVDINFNQYNPCYVCLSSWLGYLCVPIDEMIFDSSEPRLLFAKHSIQIRVSEEDYAQMREAFPTLGQTPLLLDKVPVTSAERAYGDCITVLLGPGIWKGDRCRPAILRLAGETHRVWVMDRRNNPSRANIRADVTPAPQPDELVAMINNSAECTIETVTEPDTKTG